MALPIGHDIYLHGGGLGEGAHRIMRHLDPHQGRSASQLAQLTHLSVSTVRTALAKMARSGMASRDADRLWIGQSFDAEQVAIRVGTDGLSARRRAKHQAEIQRRARAIEMWVQQERNLLLEAA